MSDANRPPRPGARSALENPWVLAAVAVALVGLVAWRSTLGMSFQDDGYYAATTLRLAQGARLFVDEMFIQSLGFLGAVPFAKLWTLLFGTTGIVAALRVFYVAVAAVVALALYRLLRPSFGPWASLAAAAAPFLAPAYNLFSVTYDTMAAIGLMLGCVLAFAAVRDTRRVLAAAGGAAAAVAAISYPPLAIAAFVLLVTLAVLGGRQLAGAMAAGAALVVVAFAAWVFATTPVADLVNTYRYVVAGWADMPKSVHGPRIAVDLWELGLALVQSWGAPLWVWFLPAAGIGVWAVLPGSGGPTIARARGFALAALPVALALPVLADWGIRGEGAIWTLGGNYLIALVLFAAPVAFLRFAGGAKARDASTDALEGPHADASERTNARSDARTFLLMAAPVGCAGFLVVVLSSNASIHWASAVVGLAPLAVAIVAVWVEGLADAIGPRAAPGAAALLISVLLVLLFGSSFKDGAPLTLGHTIRTGAYAGITTNEAHAAQVAEIGRLGARWIGPSTTVTAIEMPAAFLMVGGVPVTNSVLLNTGAADAFTVAFFDRRGWPDVVLMPLSRADQPAVETAADPLLARVARDYRSAERSALAGVAVYTKNGAAPAGL